MEPLLYLDTARLGLMSRRAREAMYSLHELVGGEGISARFVALLQHGVGVLPADLRSACRGLSDWSGLAELRVALARVLRLPAGGTVILANRSAHLMQLAARLLTSRCERVLVTDLEWPGYLEILGQELRLGGATLISVPLRSAILREGASADEVVSLLASQYRSRGCDGLFLTAVSNLGVRLPVRAVCEAVGRVAPPGCVVVDGAQAYCHSPESLAPPYCDFFIAGCHKWLGAFHPMGLGFCPRAESRELVRSVLRGTARAGGLDDPLLAFSTDLEAGTPGSYSETVSLGCLFAARAALTDLCTHDQQATWDDLLRNREALSEAVRTTGWRPLGNSPAFQTGILLLEPERRESRAADSVALRYWFLENGVALSAYDGGILRLSMPRPPWAAGELERLRAVLKAA